MPNFDLNLCAIGIFPQALNTPDPNSFNMIEKFGKPRIGDAVIAPKDHRRHLGFGEYNIRVVCPYAKGRQQANLLSQNVAN